MLKGTLFTVAACLVLGLLTVQAQTADEIVSQYEKAMGGKEKLKTLQSVYMEGVSAGQNGNEIISKQTRVNEKLLRTEINFGMGSFAMILTDQAGWMSNPRNGGAFEAMPADRVKSAQQELDLQGPLVDYAAKGHTVALEGKESISGKDAYKLKLTLKSGEVITYYIDAATHLIVRDVRKAGAMMGGARRGGNTGAAPEVTTDYSDYRPTSAGFIFPFTVKRNGMGGETIYEKIEVNIPVDASLYKPS